MSNDHGWYYLHTNKKLIFKRNPDAIMGIRESDFCHTAWKWNGTRTRAWEILIEALALGANKERIEELAQKWQCTDEDAAVFAEKYGVELGFDGNQKTAKRTDFVNLQESPCGFGDTYLEAMSELCKELGYKGGKMWKSNFTKLLE